MEQNKLLLIIAVIILILALMYGTPFQGAILDHGSDLIKITSSSPDNIFYEGHPITCGGHGGYGGLYYRLYKNGVLYSTGSEDEELTSDVPAAGQHWDCIQFNGHQPPSGTTYSQIMAAPIGTEFCPNADLWFCHLHDRAFVDIVAQCTVLNWVSSDETCQSNNLFTRTWIKSGTCSGGVTHPTTEEIACTYIPPVTIPASPNGLTATAVSTTQINLAWAVTPGATSYGIYRDSSSNKIGTVTTNKYNSTGLSPSTTYNYFVSAINSAGESSGKASITKSTLAAPTPVNGACGTTNNACTAGTSIDQADTATNYLWQCVGINGGTTSSCTLTKPIITCTSFTYTGWSACVSNSQTRSVLTKIPTDCTGGSPVTTQTCTINQTCTPLWQCTGWSDCPTSEIKTRTCTDTHNCGSTSSKPPESASCEYDSNFKGSQTGSTTTQTEPVVTGEEKTLIDRWNELPTYLQVAIVGGLIYSIYLYRERKGIFRRVRRRR